MKRILLPVTVALAALAAQAQPQDDFQTLAENTMAAAVSADGHYVVGYDPGYSAYGANTRSFIYDTRTGALSWPTEFSQDDWSKCGGFSAVTDGGIVCGTAKDPDILVTTTDWDGT